MDAGIHVHVQST